jgi:hypothetical protein
MLQAIVTGRRLSLLAIPVAAALGLNACKTPASSRAQVKTLTNAELQDCKPSVKRFLVGIEPEVAFDADAVLANTPSFTRIESESRLFRCPRTRPTTTQSRHFGRKSRRRAYT